MTYYTYILYSQKLGSFYKGHCNNINDRLRRHNSGYEKYTVKGLPWELVWFKMMDSKSEASIFEKKLKNLNQKRLIDLMKRNSEYLTDQGKEIIAKFEL